MGSYLFWDKVRRSWAALLCRVDMYEMAPWSLLTCDLKLYKLHQTDFKFHDVSEILLRDES